MQTTRADEWVDVWCDGRGAAVAELLDELQARFVRCHDIAHGDDGPGIVIVGAGTERLRNRTSQIIAVVGRGEVRQRGWELLEAGAADVVELDDPAVAAEAIAARLRRWDAVEQVLESSIVSGNLIGRNASWRALLRRVIDLAKFSTMPLLIHGESGTGKELIARLVHTLDDRDDKQKLIVLDCTTVVPELSGSEFFGHERGAYTGAVNARDGAFALADKGTLFLDEVGELPPRLQAELLRVVQEGTYKRVGGNTWQKTKFRLVCATHRNLVEDANDGRFRSDLYYRIAASTCTLPPLRERRDDIPALARHFLRQHFDDAPDLDAAVSELLLSREYPGNIRDLRHLVDRMAYRHAGKGPITLGDVPEEERPSAAQVRAVDELFERSARLSLLAGMGLKEITNAAADASVRLALDLEKGNVGRAAARLGITDRGIQKRRAAWRGKPVR